MNSEQSSSHHTSGKFLSSTSAASSRMPVCARAPACACMCTCACFCPHSNRPIVWPSDHPSLRLSIHPSIHSSICPCIILCVCACICMHVRVPACVCVCVMHLHCAHAYSSGSWLEGKKPSFAIPAVCLPLSWIHYACHCHGYTHARPAAHTNHTVRVLSTLTVAQCWLSASGLCGTASTHHATMEPVPDVLGQYYRTDPLTLRGVNASRL